MNLRSALAVNVAVCFPICHFYSLREVSEVGLFVSVSARRFSRTNQPFRTLYARPWSRFSAYLRFVETPPSAIRLIKQGEQVALNALCAIAGRIVCVNVSVWLFVKAHISILHAGS